MSALVARWLALPPNLRGILWVALSGVLFALLNVFTLIPAQHLNSYVMAFLRYVFGAMFLLPIVLRLGLYRSLHTRRMPLHVFRGALHTGGMVLRNSAFFACHSDALLISTRKRVLPDSSAATGAPGTRSVVRSPW